MVDDSLIAYILLHTKHGKNKLVYSALQKFEEIQEIHEVFGRYDLLVKIETKTITDLKKFIQNKMWLTEGVTHAETLITNDFVHEDNDVVVPGTDEDDDIFD